MISLRQLQAFISVGEHQSFTKAAKELYMTQPAVSAQIKSLEDKLDVQLLDRNDKTISLTGAGELLFEDAKKIMGVYQGFLESLDDLKGLRSGKLSLLASTIPGEYVLPQVIGSFVRQYPTVEVKLNITDTGNVVSSLLARNADLGVIGARVENEQLALEELIRDELIVIGPADTQFRNRLCSMEELVKEPWILREAGSGTRMVFAQKLAEAGIDSGEIRVVMELGTTRAVISAVECGLGLGIVSRLAAHDSLQLGKISEVNLSSGAIYRSLYLAWNNNKYQSFAARVFQAVLRESVVQSGQRGST